MGNFNQYKNTAHLYDLDQRDNLTADIPFYIDYADAQKGEILELGCGTGRVAIKLAEAGHKVTGIDLSDSMLDAFQSKLVPIDSKVRERITLVKGDMSDFYFNKKFAMIIAPFRAFQALTDNQDIKDCLICVREHLTSGGIFIVNVFNPNKKMDESWCYPEKMQWERFDEKTGNKVVRKHWGERIDTENQVIYPNFAYEVTGVDGSTERICEKLSLKYYYYEQLKELLEKSGFSILEEYGWYDKSEIKVKRELIFVCGRK